MSATITFTTIERDERLYGGWASLSVDGYYLHVYDVTDGTGLHEMKRINVAGDGPYARWMVRGQFALAVDRAVADRS